MGLVKRKKALTALSYVLSGIETAKLVKHWYDTKREYTVAVAANDDAYRAVHMELYNLLNERKHLILNTAREYKFGDDFSVSKNTRRISWQLDNKREETIWLDGHKIKVRVETPENPSTAVEGRAVYRFDRIVFTATSVPGMETIMKFITRITDEFFANETEPRFFMPGSYDDFREFPNLGKRTLDTIVLADDLKETLVADLSAFLGEEKDYSRLGLPWHRAYLFHGPPGTGKTSLACALANHFKLDVYFIPLGDMKSDTDLMRYVASIQPNSMLILEDIDIFHAATDRDDDRNGASLSGLLNALDGLSTPHGLITVITTNDMSVLDPALIRAGRVDRIEELGLVGDEQVAELFELFYKTEAPVLPSLAPIAPAEVMEVLKRNMNDPHGGEIALKKLAESRVQS